MPIVKKGIGFITRSRKEKEDIKVSNKGVGENFKELHFKVTIKKIKDLLKEMNVPIPKKIKKDELLNLLFTETKYKRDIPIDQQKITRFLV